MPSVRIRPLRPDDDADWRHLWTGYLDHYQTVVPEAVYASTFARLLGDDPQDFHGQTAVVDGRAMGLSPFIRYNR